MKKGYVVELADGSLHTIKSNFPPKRADYVKVYDALVDGGTGEFERGDWLEKSGDIVVVNASTKASVQASEASAKSALDTKQSDIAGKATTLKGLASGDLTNVTELRDAVLDLLTYLDLR